MISRGRRREPKDFSRPEELELERVERPLLLSLLLRSLLLLRLEGRKRKRWRLLLLLLLLLLLRRRRRSRSSVRRCRFFPFCCFRHLLLVFALREGSLEVEREPPVVFVILDDSC